MSDELVANFNISEGEQIDAVLKIDTQLDIQGSELIDVTKADGIATVASKTFEYEQAIASDTWVINHNLNKKPSITIVDSADNVVEGAEKYIDENTVEIRFNGAFKGKAYLN